MSLTPEQIDFIRTYILDNIALQRMREERNAEVQELREKGKGNVKDTARALEDAKALRDEADKLKPGLQAALEVLPDRKGEVETLMGSLNSASNTGDATSARGFLETLRNIVKAGEERARELKASLEMLERRKETFRTLEQSAKTRLGGTLPQPMQDKIVEGNTILAVEKEIDPAIIEKAVEASDTPLIAVETEMNRLAVLRSAWLGALGLFQPQLAQLGSHVQAAEASVDKAIKSIRETLEKASEKAAAHAYEVASETLAGLRAKLLEAENLADDCAHYKAILADREKRVGDLKNPSSHDAVKDRIETAQKSLDEAKKKVTDKDPPEYGAAVGALTPLAKECDDINWLSNRAERYVKLRTDVKGYIEARKTKEDVVAVIKRLIGKMQELYDASDYATTGDLLKSTSLLEQANSIDNELFDAKTAYQEYVTAYNEAYNLIDELKKHKGNEAIKDDIDRLKRDHDFSEEKGDNGLWPTAIKMAGQIKTEHPKLKQIADDYLAYLEAKKELETEKAKIDSQWASVVAELTAQVTAFENQASTAKSAKDYKAAKAMLDRAMEYAKLATNQIKMQKDVGQGISLLTKGIDTELEKDLAGGLGGFQSLKQLIVNGDEDNAFTDDLQKAQDHADAAKQAAEQPKPDWPTAKAELKQAAQDLQSVMYWLSQYKFCKTMHDQLNTDLGVLKGIARDDALKDEIEAIEKALEGAKDKYQRHDYAGAQSQLSDGRAKLIKAEANGKAYDEYKALRDGAIKTIRDKIWVTTSDESIKEEVDKWDEDRKAAIRLAVDDSKFAEALKALQVLEKKGNSYAGLLEDYEKAKSENENWVVGKLHWAKDRDIVKDHWERVETMRENLKRMFEKRQFKEAIGYTDDIYDVLKEADAIYQADESFKTERAKAVTAIEDLKKVRCPAVEDAIKTAEERLAAADKQAKAIVYSNAEKIVRAIPGFCATPTQTGKDAADFATAIKTAREAVEKLESDYRDLDSVRLELQVLKANLASAESKASAGDFKGAREAADAIPGLVSAVEAKAREINELAKGAEAAATASPDDATGLTQQLAKARLAYTAMTGHAGAGALGALLGQIDEALSTAEENSGKDVPAARKALAQASSDLVLARTEADNWVRADLSVKQAQTQAGTVRVAHPEPLALQQRLDTVDKELGLARENTERREFSTALNYVQAAESELALLDALGKAHKTYADKKAELDKSVEDLAKHAGRYSISKELVQIRQLLETALEKAGALDHSAAMKALAEAEAKIEAAAITADMSANEELDEKKIKALLAKEGGGKKLDEIIRKLDPQTQRKAVHKALELRFDLKLQQFKSESDFSSSAEDTTDAAAAPNILRLYDVMHDLPPEHTTDNPSMALVQRIGDDLGTSSFSGSKKVLKLRVGRATDGNEKLIGMPNELDPLDSRAAPKGEGKPQAFNWTTLHEIGHAVDDKLRYMSRKGKEGGMGGWKVYARDVKEIAQAAAAPTAFNYNADYVEAYLSNPSGKLLYPDPEGGASQEDWDRRRIDVEAWCDSIRVGKSIWNSAAASNNAAIGGRVYQQSYDWEWVSYDLSARSLGVRGYQFRAPGEWFAELYAAYHTDKLNDGHPARVWLADL